MILFIPCSFPPLLSPLHPSISFFHVCSAVKPSSIRPASLITCAICGLWNQVGQKQSWLQWPYLCLIRNLPCMEIRLNVIHLFLVFNTKDQICNIYWLKAHVHVHSFINTYLYVIHSKNSRCGCVCGLTHWFQAFIFT